MGIGAPAIAGGLFLVAIWLADKVQASSELWRSDGDERDEQSVEQHVSALAGETVDGAEHHQSS